MEELEVKKKYQWTTGPRSNQLEVYLAEDDTHIWFESGRSIPKEMMDVQLRQIEDSMYQALMVIRNIDFNNNTGLFLSCYCIHGPIIL